MIAKITRGGSFRGAARYVLDERRSLDRDHQPEMIGGNMAGRTSAELTAAPHKKEARGASGPAAADIARGLCLEYRGRQAFSSSF